jgi:putative peptide zinc metalloprotease protein
MKRTTLILAALLAGLTLAAVTPANVHAQDNAAVAVNTKDGTSIFRVAFKIARVNQQIVDESNAAAAWASCTDCEAIAAAFQIVLIFSDPDVVTPTNLALAVNWECTTCLAFASAYQWVLTTEGPVHFTAEGNRRLAEVRQRLHELTQLDLTLEELIAELETLAAIIREVLANEMVSTATASEPPPPAPAQTTTEPTASEPTTTTEATQPTSTTETTTTETTETTTTEPTTTTATP